ncbi:hypothetical protein Tco_1398990 [Tanacetum coccineum]
MRPFGCPVTILNTIDHLGKFDGKADEGFFVGSGPNWLFDIDALTKSMNYKPVDSPDAGFKPSREEKKKDAEDPGNESGNLTKGKDSEVTSTIEPKVNQEKDAGVYSNNTINIVSPTVNTAGIEDNVVDENIVYGCDDDPNMPELEEIVYLDNDEDVGAEADINNLDTHIPVIPILTTRIHKDHPVEQIIRDIYSTPQTRRMLKSVTEQAMFSSVQQRTNHKDF